MVPPITSITQIVCDNLILTIHPLPLVASCLVHLLYLFSSLFITPIFFIMTQFKRVISQFLRLQPRFRQPLLQCCVSTPTANTEVAYNEPDSSCKLAHLDPESEVQNVQPSTNTVLQKVEEVEEYDDGDKGEYNNEEDKDIPKVFPYDLVRETHIEMEVQNVQPSTDTTAKKFEKVEECDDDDEYDDEDDDVPEVFPYDLARKTHIEMMIGRLYIAVADNDREIAALRTRHREKFSHIVRVAVDPLSPRHDNITPSSWASEEIYPNHDNHDNGPCELRLTCPALTRHYRDDLTALKEKQLIAARNYIARALPNRNEAWEKEGLEFPFSPAECEDARVLIVAPTDRSVDVMAVVVCYMAFLTGTEADRLLGGLKRLTFVNSHWGGDILGKDSLDMAGAVSKQKW